ncbi:hypothetical protein LCGC14_0174760 [marine sediment metagenome]|uniref:Uncharacterized protein n=1 Tax=marine sediment metagenome TaxID=412755 RepID=A0A0F9V7B1_9ZZZZ
MQSVLEFRTQAIHEYEISEEKPHHKSHSDIEIVRVDLYDDDNNLIKRKERVAICWDCDYSEELENFSEANKAVDIHSPRCPSLRRLTAIEKCGNCAKGWNCRYHADIGAGIFARQPDTKDKSSQHESQRTNIEKMNKEIEGKT